MCVRASAVERRLETVAHTSAVMFGVWTCRDERVAMCGLRCGGAPYRIWVSAVRAAALRLLTQ